ncbi:MAG: serine hydrolase [Streptosporangiaceae bacterium]
MELVRRGIRTDVAVHAVGSGRRAGCQVHHPRRRCRDLGGRPGELRVARVTSAENPLPVDQDTLFLLGSVSKTYTASALMVLVEQGKVELEAPVRRCLPDLRSPTRRPPPRSPCCSCSTTWPASNGG